jgi:hypothetical protein
MARELETEPTLRGYALLLRAQKCGWPGSQ